MKQSLKRFARSIRGEYVCGLLRALASPRNRLQTFKVGGKRVRLRPPSFVSQYRDIFIEKEYDFRTATEVPRILDLGANVGLSCMFFKSIYPAAHIEAFEADPEIFSILSENIAAAGLKNIQIHNQAVWVEDTIIEFQPNGLGGGRISEISPRTTTITVEAFDLKFWLQGKTFDLIKMDIEGAETSVIPHCIEEISRSPRLIFEYHSRRNQPQALADLLTMLRDHDYRVYLKTCNASMSPFRNLQDGHADGEFDNLINVFADRTNDALPDQESPA